MPEWNRERNYERNQVSSSKSDLDVDHVMEDDFDGENHLPGRSEDFVPHVITRMPDLTGYGGEISPQNISLYRPKRKGVKLNFDVLKKISLQKWCAAAAICVVCVTVVWSLTRSPERMPESLQNEPQSHGDHASVSKTENERHFAAASDSRPLFSGLNNPYDIADGSQSVIPVDSASTDMPRFSPGFSDVATVPPDASSHTLPPWERQPNRVAENMTIQQQQFGMPIQDVGNPSVSAASPGGSWPNYSQFAGTDPNRQNVSAGFSPASQENPSFGPMSAQPETTVYQQQPNFAPNQIAAGFGSVPQQVYHQNPPSVHENAVAFNTGAAPPYSQGPYQQGQYSQGQFQQGQYPQNQWASSQNGTAMTQNPPQQTWQNQGMQNSAAPTQYVPQQGQQPAYAGTPSQYDVQVAMQTNATNGYSNVPMATSGQSYRDPNVTGTNLYGTVNQYPADQTQPSYR